MRNRNLKTHQDVVFDLIESSLIESTVSCSGPPRDRIARALRNGRGYPQELLPGAWLQFMMKRRGEQYSEKVRELRGDDFQTILRSFLSELHYETIRAQYRDRR